MTGLPDIKPQDGYDLTASWDTFSNGDYENEIGGLRTWKLHDDLQRYFNIIEATRPEVIVETGTKFGGSALWFKAVGEQLGYEIDVITIDIDKTFSEKARQEFPGIHWLIGDSLDGAVLLATMDLIDGRRTMVSLDSEHATPHVVAEIQAYGPLVTPGCYLVVEDGIFDLVDTKYAHLGGARIPAEGGPLHAIAQTLARDSNWKRDTATENLTARSHHPAGFWLRREPKPAAAPRKAAAPKAANAKTTTPKAAKTPKGTGALTAA
jgi:cephalosporin hydroxylase